MKRWPPDPNVHGYSGPYPLNDLRRARRQLIQRLMPPHRPDLARVLPKVGIDSEFGRALVPLPPPTPSPPSHSVPNGLVTATSHSNVVPKQTLVTPPPVVHRSASCVMSPPVQVSNWTAVRIARSASLQDTNKADLLQPPTPRTTAAKVPATIRHSSSEDVLPVKVTRTDDRGSVSDSKNLTAGSTTLHPTRIYKCDYCRFSGSSNHDMKTHLSRSRHASASEYSTKDSSSPTTSGPELNAVEQMMAISSGDRSNHAALVIACPECRSVFEDIFICALHNKYEHGDSSGSYAVCPVIHSEVIELGSMTCSVCQQHFSDANDLTAHWVAEQDHCPAIQSTDNRVFHVHTCPNCKRTFNDDFLDCVLHMVEDHSVLTQVEVRHVMLPQRRERLPPFSSDKNSPGGLRDEATVLSRLQNCFEQSAINDRLEQIQKLLASTT